MPGMQELVVIALVALFVLGPERLPEVMRAGGRLLTRVRNYGVTASKELRGVADLRGFGSIEQEVSELRRELDRTRADLRRAIRETMASADPKLLHPDTPDTPGTATDTDTDTDTDTSAGAPVAAPDERE